MKSSVVLGVLLGAFVSNANAFTLELDFPQGKPAAMDFAYAVSSGDCTTTAGCYFDKASFADIKDFDIKGFLDIVNSWFKPLTAVQDNVNSPTNYVAIKLKGQSAVCRANLLGKQNIKLAINADGTCIES